jgi:hypothetical protein
MAKIQIGDIFKISTSKGAAYLHYVYKDPHVAELIRVLPGLFSQTPDDIQKVAESEEKYMLFFPLSAAFRRKMVSYAGHYDLPNFAKPSYMRTDWFVRGVFLGWHIVNTDTWFRTLVKDLTLEQKKLSPWDIWNDTLLIERLEQGWTLDQWT